MVIFGLQMVRLSGGPSNVNVIKTVYVLQDRHIHKCEILTRELSLNTKQIIGILIRQNIKGITRNSTFMIFKTTLRIYNKF